MIRLIIIFTLNFDEKLIANFYDLKIENYDFMFEKPIR